MVGPTSQPSFTGVQEKVAGFDLNSFVYIDANLAFFVTVSRKLIFYIIHITVKQKVKRAANVASGDRGGRGGRGGRGV